jgi:hypothetical protein
MRSGAAWTDIVIKSMSVRELTAETAQPPRRDSFVEIRRGTQVIIGCVIWSEAERFGVRAQDRIDVDALVTEPRLASRPARNGDGAAGGEERRRDPERRGSADIAERAEQSRRRSAALQFVIVVSLGGIAAAVLGSEVYDALSTPLTAIGSVLPGS